MNPAAAHRTVATARRQLERWSGVHAARAHNLTCCTTSCTACFSARRVQSRLQLRKATTLDCYTLLAHAASTTCPAVSQPAVLAASIFVQTVRSRFQITRPSRHMHHVCVVLDHAHILSFACFCTSCLQTVRSRFQMHKSITPDYYGFRDEEDGVLLAVEAEAEATIQAQVGY